MKFLHSIIISTALINGAYAATPAPASVETPAKAPTKAPTEIPVVASVAPKVYFIAPHNGAMLKNPVTVQFGLKGMGVAPAGIQKENTGHHHLLIDVETLPDMRKPLPADDQHKHFGGGQTETQLTLTPGKHTLQLLLGDQIHIPHNPPVLSDKITILVTE
ncbi:MAG: DUF4399 domain-containing protein [Gammaproteobacteria bacterium]|nr:DUF4399 domain-containing protein [Gammaproteobacteria bacterium]